MTIDGNDMKSDSGFVSESPFILYVANGFVWGGFVRRAGVRCSERTVTIPYLCTTVADFYLCFHTTRAKEAILKRVSHM